jgi:hypothetical protein
MCYGGENASEDAAFFYYLTAAKKPVSPLFEVIEMNTR